MVEKFTLFLSCIESSKVDGEKPASSRERISSGSRLEKTLSIVIPEFAIPEYPCLGRFLFLYETRPPLFRWALS